MTLLQLDKLSADEHLFIAMCAGVTFHATLRRTWIASTPDDTYRTLGWDTKHRAAYWALVAMCKWTHDD